jgi:hypothetical protein
MEVLDLIRNNQPYRHLKYKKMKMPLILGIKDLLQVLPQIITKMMDLEIKGSREIDKVFFHPKMELFPI